MTHESLVLASTSPRRRELLSQYGVCFSVVPPGVEEPARLQESPEAYALRCARTKAEAVANGFPLALVLGADTVVVFGEEILGKPGSPEGTRRMLERLSGRTHDVITAVVLLRLDPPFRRETVVRSTVTFKELAPTEIADYAKSGEGDDKAGGYAIQGEGGRLISSFTGSFTNIVGLPMEEVRRLLAEAEAEAGKNGSGKMPA